jgi:pimeloyl-ACP methyl ester carboxylesterase
MLALAATIMTPARGAVSAATAPSCENDFGTKTPVLLVHGFREGPGVWTSMTHTIETAIPGVAVVAPFDYQAENTQWVNNANIGPKLAREITCLATASGVNGGLGKVIVIAHSMGGLAVRCAVDPACAGADVAANAKQIGLVITLGTPNTGSLLATTGDVLSDTGSVACTVLAAEGTVPGCPDLLGWLFGANSPAATAMAVGPDGKPSPDLQALKALPSGIPLYALAGKVTVTTSLFDLPPFQVSGPELGDFGDLVVSVDSALDGAPPSTPAHPGRSTPHPGPGSGSGTISCGTVSLPSLMGPLSASVIPDVTCWHLTELTDSAWQAAVVNQIKEYQSSAQVVDWLNATYTTSCGGIATQPFSVTVHNGQGQYQTTGSPYQDYNVAVTSVAHGYLLGDGTPQIAVLLSCSPQPSNYSVTEIQVFTPERQELGTPLRPPNLVPNGLYNLPFFDDQPFTIGDGLLNSGAAYYGPEDCHACGPSIQYQLSWQWTGRNFTLKKATKLSGPPPH